MCLLCVFVDHSDSALLRFSFPHDDRYGYNVFVSDSPFACAPNTNATSLSSPLYLNSELVESLSLSGLGQCTHVPSLTNPVQDIYSNGSTSTDSTTATTPQFTSAAGTNSREYVNSTMVLVIRGGRDNRYYTIRRVPMLTIQLTTTHRVTWQQAIHAKTILAKLLNSTSQLMIIGTTNLLNLTTPTPVEPAPSPSSHRRLLRRDDLQNTDITDQNNSSTNATTDKDAHLRSIIEIGIVPSASLYVARSYAEQLNQIHELVDIFANVSKFFAHGDFESRWNVSLYEAQAELPNIPKGIDENEVDIIRARNPAYNVAELRVNLTAYNKGTVMALKIVAQVVNPGGDGGGDINGRSIRPTQAPTEVPDHSKTDDMGDAYKKNMLTIIVSLSTVLVFLFCLGFAGYSYSRQVYFARLTQAKMDIKNTDLFVLMRLFHVTDAQDLLPAYKQQILILLDILFVKTSSHHVQSSVVQVCSSLASSSSYQKKQLQGMNDVLDLLIKKSVILNKQHIDSLLDTLHTLVQQREQLLLAEDQQAIMRQNARWFISTNTTTSTTTNSHNNIRSNKSNISAAVEMNSSNQQQRNDAISSSFIISMPSTQSPHNSNNNSEEEEVVKTSHDQQQCTNEVDVIETTKCVISVVYQYYTQQLTLHHQQQQERQQESVELLSQLNMSHVALTQLVQENKTLTLLQIYKIMSHEKYLFKRLVKIFVSPEYMHLFHDPPAVTELNNKDINSNSNSNVESVHVPSPAINRRNNNSSHVNLDTNNNSRDVNVEAAFINEEESSASHSHTPPPQYQFMMTEGGTPLPPLMMSPAMSFNNQTSPNFTASPTSFTLASTNYNNNANNNNLMAAGNANVSAAMTSLDQFRPPPLVFNFPTNKVQKPVVTVLSAPSSVETQTTQSQSLSAMSTELKLTPLNIEVVSRYNNNQRQQRMYPPIIIHEDNDYERDYAGGFSGLGPSITRPVADQRQAEQSQPMQQQGESEQQEDQSKSTFVLPPLAQALQHMNIDLDALTRNHTNPYFSLIAEYHYEEDGPSHRRRKRNKTVGVNAGEGTAGNGGSDESDVSSSPLSRRSGQLSSDAESDLFDCNDSNHTDSFLPHEDA